MGDLGVGFATGLSLIVAIGSQNAFVLRMGLLRQHVGALVLFCALSDAVLIMAGIGGAGALLRGNDALLAATKYGGAAFLACYGLLALRRAVRGGQMQLQAPTTTTLGSALAACFAFTFLNPHVYLDTVVLLGSIANQREHPGPWVFGAGACIASVLWFAALGYGARLLAPVFQTVMAWRVLDACIALVMFGLVFVLIKG